VSHALMLADDCCAVAAILQAPGQWRVPDVPPGDSLLAAGSHSVAALNGQRHASLRYVMREGVQKAHRHAMPIVERVLVEASLPASGRIDLVREFIAPAVFRVKAWLIGDAALSSTVASWSATMFGGSWDPTGASADSPARVIARVGERAGPAIAYWRRCVADGRMTGEELEGAVLLFAVAGNDAVIATAARCVAELAEDADLQRRLRERPGSVAGFVARTVTREPPVRYTFRIRPGGGLTVVSLVAGRKGQTCPIHGERLALPFGRGAHACLGAELGLELAAKTIETVLARTEWIVPAGNPTAHPNGTFNGFVEVPTILGPREGVAT
jgi:cytochrome P450